MLFLLAPPLYAPNPEKRKIKSKRKNDKKQINNTNYIVRVFSALKVYQDPFALKVLVVVVKYYDSN